MLLRMLSALMLLPMMSYSAANVDQRIRARTHDFAGKVTIYAKNLETGATYSFGGDEPVRTASTIKLPVMIETFAESAEGKINMGEGIHVPADEKVSGSGILSELSIDPVPMRDLVMLMITLSDNTATNLILMRIGGNAVNNRMAALGLKETRVMRKILGDGNKLKALPTGITDEGAKPENKRWGIGRTTPHEMVTLLEMLYRGQVVSKQASGDMLEILKKQQDHGGIARDLKDVVVANKSGALDALRSDVGIAYTKQGAIAMAITVDDMPKPDWTSDNAGELMISAISEILIEGLR